MLTSKYDLTFSACKSISFSASVGCSALLRLGSGDMANQARTSTSESGVDRKVLDPSGCSRRSAISSLCPARAGGTNNSSVPHTNVTDPESRRRDTGDATSAQTCRSTEDRVGESRVRLLPFIAGSCRKCSNENSDLRTNHNMPCSR